MCGLQACYSQTLSWKAPFVQLIFFRPILIEFGRKVNAFGRYSIPRFTRNIKVAPSEL